MWKLTAALCLIWTASILYGEMLAFWLPSLWSCNWPHLSRSSSSPNSTINGIDYVKVAVLTDPQIMDRTSLQLDPKSFASEMAKFYTDIYTRRAFVSSVMPFKPDVILFLGDYFDGGPYLSDKEWQESLSRFKHIFHLNSLEKRSSDIQVHYIPGNHDIGYAGLLSSRPEVIRRYEKEFGIRNFRFTVGKVEFIAIDAQTVDGLPEEYQTLQTWDFVKKISTDVQNYPRVLLTHIPLYRPDWTDCGPHRSSPVINQRIAQYNQKITYQNYITEASSIHLLDMIKPVLILSGHDHDQCTVTHNSKLGPVREHTVGTVSWQMGNLYPSFMLLSVSNSSLPNASWAEESTFTHLCFLPVQTFIYVWYLVLFVVTLLIALLWPTSGISFFHRFTDMLRSSRQFLSCNIFNSGTKEKNEDENCEYEMIWDAEGSMHLVKRTLNTRSIPSTDSGSTERGNAVMRPTARRQSSEVAQVSVNVDTNTDMGSDPALKLPHRTTKTKTRIVVQRLVRTFRMVSIIAAVNIPLYMMFLFKDWIEQ